MTNQSGDATNGDAMSDIERFTLYGCVWVRYDDHQAEIERLIHERDEARAERDAAQRERERLQDLLRCERQELSTLRERLRQPRRDQSAQNLSIANGQAILDSSRPDDETIWREVFVRSVNTPSEFKVAFADWALAEYRKRWPR